MFSHWREIGAHIPDAWPGAWLTFLSKPNKAGNKPDHLRPIALLEPAGKAVSGIIKEHLTPYLEAWTRHLHFYGYLGNRSTHQAQDLVFAHCELVRTRTQAQGRSPYAKRAGIGQYKCIGGLQVSVDCTQAFDRIDRGLLLQALTLLQVPLPLVDIIMRWVQDTTYHINQDDCEETFTSRRGVRQGCKLSPTLWCCIMVFIAHSLDHSLGARWCLEHLVGFADDLHLRWTFSTLAEMHTALRQAAQALAILEKMSLVLSKEKTVCLLKAEGSQAPHAKKKIIVQTQDGKYLQLSPDYRLPLKRQHPYLGAIISYADFENQNAKHRVQAGKVAFQRLRPYLMNRRALPFAKRVALWKAAVVSSTLYGITASGITPKGLDLMRVTLTKQVRAMANLPRHLTLESDHDFWQRLRLKAPTNCSWTEHRPFSIAPRSYFTYLRRAMSGSRPPFLHGRIACSLSSRLFASGLPGGLYTSTSVLPATLCSRTRRPSVHTSRGSTVLTDDRRSPRSSTITGTAPMECHSAVAVATNLRDGPT